jgi:hypothetical protein
MHFKLTNTGTYIQLRYNCRQFKTGQPAHQFADWSPDGASVLNWGFSGKADGAHHITAANSPGTANSYFNVARSHSDTHSDPVSNYSSKRHDSQQLSNGKYWPLTWPQTQKHKIFGITCTNLTQKDVQYRRCETVFVAFLCGVRAELVLQPAAWAVSRSRESCHSGCVRCKLHMAGMSWGGTGHCDCWKRVKSEGGGNEESKK